MLYKDICYLGDIKQITNEYGDIEDTITYGDYKFTNVKSIGYREFYEAQVTGYKPEIKLELSSFDYDMQGYVKYNGIEYKVIRTYQNGLDRIELILERGINGST